MPTQRKRVDIKKSVPRAIGISIESSSYDLPLVRVRIFSALMSVIAILIGRYLAWVQPGNDKITVRGTSPDGSEYFVIQTYSGTRYCTCLFIVACSACVLTRQQPDIAVLHGVAVVLQHQ